jgi:hypothetical protein
MIIVDKNSQRSKFRELANEQISLLSEKGNLRTLYQSMDELTISLSDEAPSRYHLDFIFTYKNKLNNTYDLNVLLRYAGIDKDRSLEDIIRKAYYGVFEMILKHKEINSDEFTYKLSQELNEELPTNNKKEKRIKL